MLPGDFLFQKTVLSQVSGVVVSEKMSWGAHKMERDWKWTAGEINSKNLTLHQTTGKYKASMLSSQKCCHLQENKGLTDV